VGVPVNQIFAEAARPVVSRLGSVRPHLFHIKEVRGHPWPSEDTVHGLPPGGLLVGREFCDEEAWEPGERDAMISWNRLVGTPDLELEVEPDALVAEQPDLRESDVPPPAFLRFLKSLAAETGTVVSYYAAASFGGELDFAYSWVFGARERAFVFQSPGMVRELGGGEGPRLMEGEVIVWTLRHHGLLLRTPYFAPHTLEWDWSKHRLSGPTAVSR